MELFSAYEKEKPIAVVCGAHTTLLLPEVPAFIWFQCFGLWGHRPRQTVKSVSSIPSLFPDRPETAAVLYGSPGKRVIQIYSQSISFC